MAPSRRLSPRRRRDALDDQPHGEHHLEGEHRHPHQLRDRTAEDADELQGNAHHDQDRRENAQPRERARESSALAAGARRRACCRGRRRSRRGSRSTPARSTATAASAFAAAGSGASAPAAVASHAFSSNVGIETAPITPSATRQVRPSIARSGSWSRVIAYSVTASTRAQKQPTSARTKANRIWDACWAMFASFAAIPSPLPARVSRVTGGRRRPRRRVQPGVHLPQGRLLRGSSTATPTGCAPRSSARTASCARPPGSEAFDAVAAGLRPVVERYGPNAVGVVLGNPNVHTMAGALYPPVLLAGARHPQPLHRVHGRPDAQARLQRAALRRRQRDPRARPRPHRPSAAPRRQPAGVQRQPVHRPRLPRQAQGPARRAAAPSPSSTRAAPAPPSSPTGTSPSGPAPTRCCSRRMAYVLFEEDLVDLGRARRASRGARRTPRTPYGTSLPKPSPTACDVDAGTIRALARELAAAPTAAVYGRIGSCTVPHGTLASWLVDVLNILTGNLDRPGGALFPLAATDRTPRARRTRPRLRARPLALAGSAGHPEAKGELPLAALAEEIDTATAEGEPDPRPRSPSPPTPCCPRPTATASTRPSARSTSWSASTRTSTRPRATPTSCCRRPRPRRARTTTSPSTPSPYATRSATPAPPSPWSPAAWPRREILARLVLAATGMHGADPLRRRRPGHRPDPRQGRQGAALARCTAATRANSPPQLTGDTGPERRLDLMLRLGPYGDGFGVRPGRADPGEAARAPARHRPRTAPVRASRSR